MRLVDAVEKRFGAKLRVVRHDLSAGKQAFRDFVDRLDRAGVNETPKLSVFIDNQCLSGADAIARDLDAELVKRLGEPGAGLAPTAAAAPQPATPTVVARPVKRTSLWLVSLAGLADGVNPCAFATVILFVSMLSSVGRQRRDILGVGLCFIVAVFLTYFAIGLAFFEAMNLLKHVAWLHAAITWGALGLAVLAGVLSLVDAWRAWRTGGKGEMLLVLPEKLKNSIRKRLRATAHSSTLFAGAFVSGVVISFLESACTGQVYFPLIAGLVNNEDTRLRGLLLLGWYNLLFVIPLLAVFIAAFVGISSERVASLARGRVWMTKLALAAVFFALAGWLGSTLLA